MQYVRAILTTELAYANATTTGTRLADAVPDVRSTQTVRERFHASTRIASTRAQTPAACARVAKSSTITRFASVLTTPPAIH